MEAVGRTEEIIGISVYILLPSSIVSILLFAHSQYIFISSHDNGVLPVVFYCLIVIPYLYLSCIKSYQGCLPSFAVFFMLIGNYLFYLYSGICFQSASTDWSNSKHEIMEVNHQFLWYIGFLPIGYYMLHTYVFFSLFIYSCFLRASCCSPKVAFIVSFQILVLGFSAFSLFLLVKANIGPLLSTFQFMVVLLFLMSQYFLLRHFVHLMSMIRSIWDIFRLSYVPSRIRKMFLLYAVLFEMCFLYAILIPLFEDISEIAKVNSFPYIFIPVAIFLGIGMLILSGLINCAISLCYRRRRFFRNLSQIEEQLNLDSSLVGADSLETSINECSSLQISEIDLSKNGMCPICLNEFTDDVKEVVVTHKPCGNGFHKECLVKWLVNQKACPMCRGSVLE